MVAAPASAADLTELAKREFACAQGDVYLQGSGSKKHYPAAKRETVVLGSDTGILRYTCNYVRSIVSCPIGTEKFKVRRGPTTAKFLVTCMGTYRTRGADVRGVDAAAGDDE